MALTSQVLAPRLKALDPVTECLMVGMAVRCMIAWNKGIRHTGWETKEYNDTSTHRATRMLNFLRTSSLALSPCFQEV
jgi:hypothetical protein